jgi:hypothetical protein
MHCSFFSLRYAIGIVPRQISRSLCILSLYSKTSVRVKTRGNFPTATKYSTQFVVASASEVVKDFTHC